MIAGNLSAEPLSNELERCVIDEIRATEQDISLDEAIQRCRQLSKEKTGEKTTPLQKRIKEEQATLKNRHVITPHKANYFMPFTLVSHPNDSPFDSLGGGPGDGSNLLDNYEAKFQISFKAPIASHLMNNQDNLFFGFTLVSYWQMYNSELSAPFRETNYQPEIFYVLLNDFNVGPWINRALMVGIEHQSNGRSQPFSRSWNRLYANFVWENQDWIVAFKPWYRLPEKKKTDPLQPDGDDNPDIERYLGHFELMTALKYENHTLAMTFRNNLRRDNKGSLQMDWTFPMGSRFRGYAQLFVGYGDSLIDYDRPIRRIGVGVSLTDIF